MPETSPQRCRLCDERFESRDDATDHLGDDHDLYAIVTDAALEDESNTHGSYGGLSEELRDVFSDGEGDLE
jgi:hypothetical protein